MPTLPCGKLGDHDGYLFSDDTQRRASYFAAIDTLGLMSNDGCALSLERWLDSSFVLPFRLSHELNSYPPDISERLIQTPPLNHAKTRLFLAFEKETTYVIRSVYH